MSVWDFKVQFLKGVGEKIAKIYQKADVYSFGDLLLNLPRSYEDRRKLCFGEDLVKAAQSESQVITKVDLVRFVPKRAGKSGRSWIEAHCVLSDKSRLPLVITWFHNPRNYVQRTFREGESYIVNGKAKAYRGQIQFVHPVMSKSGTGQLPAWEMGCVVPVYSEISGLSSRIQRKIMAQALEKDELNSMEDSIPQDLLDDLHLPPIKQSFKELHFPKNWEPNFEDPKAEGPFLARIVFEELFMMALALLIRRAQLRKLSQESTLNVPRVPSFKETLKEFIPQIPFELTGDQSLVLKEISEDLSEEVIAEHGAMHRLVQGDVGSGKTIVAFLSLLAFAREGFQAAMMAPTAILAEQHFNNFISMFPEMKNKAILLRGALTEKQKKLCREQLKSGEKSVVIGTQALLTHDTVFSKLGLVLIDEQHRFGVEQRLNLKQQSGDFVPHLMVMTATPIPRSLALTLYGDLNLSVIKEKPRQRIEIETHLLREKQRSALLRRMGDFVAEGRQIYLIYPLVEESDKLDLTDVKTAHLKWSKEFPNAKVELLHGRMKEKEKDQIMARFKANEIQLLVSTTVVEVGVDVPNASVIIIEHAERYGLSQLHQLRGRVGRGSVKSYCILMGPNFMNPLVKERLEVMVKSTDGFFIAERDMDLRGPGEFLGRRQSGLPGFRVAHLLRDLHWLERARSEAQKILKDDPFLKSPQHLSLKKAIKHWWKGRLDLTLSG